jgi:hypothetical protein
MPLPHRRRQLQILQSSWSQQLKTITTQFRWLDGLAGPEAKAMHKVEAKE